MDFYRFYLFSPYDYPIDSHMAFFNALVCKMAAGGRHFILPNQPESRRDCLALRAKGPLFPSPAQNILKGKIKNDGTDLYERKTDPAAGAVDVRADDPVNDGEFPL